MQCEDARIVAKMSGNLKDLCKNDLNLGLQNNKRIGAANFSEAMKRKCPGMKIFQGRLK